MTTTDPHAKYLREKLELRFISLRVPHETYEEIKRAAMEEKVTLNTFILEAIEWRIISG